jgi:hypothetical protein
MPSRIGIEISPAACRIVQLDRPGNGDDADTIVRTFTCAAGPGEATLAPYRGQHVALVMWGLRGDHRQAVVTVRSYARMRREAVSATRQAGVDTRQMLADITPVTSGKGAKRRPVVVALANTSAVAAAVRPLTAAGLRVRSVVSPALALMSLARLRRGITAAGVAEAYVALEETTTAIALLRDGALIAARELEWGYQDEQRQVRSRDDVSARLAGAIEEFFGDCGAPPSAVAQVCVCGGMPELRSMTLALTERLDVEVEPLDSLFGVANEPPGDDLRDRAADMRLAWAVAADWNAPINFLRERRRRVVKSALTRAAVVAGVATGLGIAWRIQRSALLEPSKPQPKAQPAAAVPVSPRPVAPSLPPEPVPSPLPAPVPSRVVAPPPAAALPPPQPTPSPVVVQSPPVAAQQPPAKAPVPVSVPAPIPAPAQIPARPALVLTPVPEPPRPAPAREPPTTSTRVPSAAAPPPLAVAPVRRPPPEEAPRPFDATLGSILYGADRKLAIIDGRIVQVGDEVRGARVVEITPNSVLFRDREGRLRRLSLEDPGR